MEKNTGMRVVLACNSCNNKITFTENNITDFSNRVTKSGKNVETFMKEFVCKPCCQTAKKVQTLKSNV